VERRRFVAIALQGPPYVGPVLALCRRPRARSRRVVVALQAYLYRTAQDVESLMPLGSAIRLVKGAYLEPATIAYPKKADVDENFYALACRLLSDEAQRRGTLLHIATHDPRLVDRLNAYVAERHVPANAYE